MEGTRRRRMDKGRRREGVRKEEKRRE